MRQYVNLAKSSHQMIGSLLLCIGICYLSTASAQTISGQIVVEQAKEVVLRDLQLTNDTAFIPRGHHRTNVYEEKKRPQQKTLEEPYQEPFQATYIIPETSAGRSALINETPCVDYAGMRFQTFIPPDVAGAAGHDHLLHTENDSFRVMDKYGNILQQQLQQDGTGLWAGLYSNNLFDPKAMYDPYANRWIHVILADSRMASSAILIAVSAGPDPLGTWYLWAIDTDGENDQWFDYPSIGFNNKWLAINGVMFPTPGSSADQVNRMFVFQLSQLYAGGTIGYTIFTTTGYEHIVPALTYDPGMGDIWCVTNDDVDDNDLRFFKISGSAGSPSLTEEGFISLSPDWGLGGDDLAPQLGSSVRLNTGDHRILSAMWRGGRLYASQTVFLPDGDSPTTCTIQFVSCTPSSETVHEAIRFTSDQNSMYAYPNLVVTASGDIVISCARFTNAIYPSACVLVRRVGSGWVETIFKAGEDWYVNMDSQSRNRWGDYTACYIDPSDDNSVWVMSEYSRPRDASNNGQWGTWIARICTGVCPGSVTVSATQTGGTIKKFEAGTNIYANGQINANANIKFDSGDRITLQPGFKALIGSQLRAFIEGCEGPQ